jgi:glutamine synthetase
LNVSNVLISWYSVCKLDCSAEFLVGFESEFILLKSTDPVTASNIHAFASTAGILSGSVEAKIMHEVAECLTLSNIPLQMFHPEAAPGQYEVVSGPLPPVEACDALIYTREIIANVASKHGLRATFAPRPFLNSTGSSTHAHFSVHSTNQASTKPSGHMSQQEQSFLAGLLEHLSAVAAFTLPTAASYKRAVDGAWSGGTYVSYGTENRECPIRLTNPASSSSRRFELRFIDGTANPHLAMAAIIRAGMTGLKGQKPLTVRSCDGVGAALMTSEERAEMGITKRMPLSVGEARNYLLEDKVMGDALGPEMVKQYVSVNRCLEQSLSPEGEDEAQLLTRLVEFF